MLYTVTKAGCSWHISSQGVNGTAFQFLLHLFLPYALRTHTGQAGREGQAIAVKVASKLFLPSHWLLLYEYIEHLWFLLSLGFPGCSLFLMKIEVCRAHPPVSKACPNTESDSAGSAGTWPSLLVLGQWLPFRKWEALPSVVVGTRGLQTRALDMESECMF